MKTKILLIIVCLIAQFMSFAQVEQEKLIGAYTYNFAKYTTWMNESEIQVFNINVISSNKNVIKEFKEFAKNRTLKGRNIHVSFNTKLPDSISNSTQIIVLTEDKSELYSDLYKASENKSVLLVTQNISDKYNVMINLFSSPDGKLLFEVNKANMINHNLIVDPEILLLGGTEIDVAELYRKSQKAIENLQSDLNTKADSFSILNNKIEEIMIQIDSQKTKIDSQNNLLQVQNKALEQGEVKIKKYSSDINLHQNRIRDQKALLEKQVKSINEQKEKLLIQEKLVKTKEAKIESEKRILDSLNIEIDQQNNILTKQNSIIKRQKLTVILAITTGLLFLFILIVIFFSFRNNLKNNKLLTQQKEEIEEINRNLKITNTELVDTINKLNATQAQLITSEKMASLGVLTAGVAHEINNPVNFIYTGINSLQLDLNDLLNTNKIMEELVENEAPPEILEKIQLIKKENELDETLDIIQQTVDDIKVGAERTTEIVKGLRNFSRMDKDATQMYDVHKGLDSALLLLRNKYKGNIEIIKSYQKIPPIQCYSGKLNQVFLNILSNAIDAIEDDGEIRINTNYKKEKVSIQITDNGKGIPENILDKIFDPFFTTKNVGDGVGLGLSISFGIIEEHNGKIEVKSELNSGTTFTILLPCNVN